MKPISTRKKILEYLLTHSSATVWELSTWLHLTKADVRYQLNLLMTEGMIQRNSPPEIHPEPGRPSASFALKSKNLPPVVSRYLEGLGSLLTDPNVEDATREFVLESIIQSLTKDFHPHSTGSQKMDEIIQYLEGLGFQAKWEPGTSGPKIIIYNNPAAFYLNHPLIRYDGTDKLIKTLLSK